MGINYATDSVNCNRKQWKWVMFNLKTKQRERKNRKPKETGRRNSKNNIRN